MIKPAALIAAGALLAAAYVYMKNQGEAVTAGDEEADILSDAIDTMNSTFSNWPSGSAPYQDTVQQSADQYGVPVNILAWLLWKESRYNPRIISGEKRSAVGAMGIAQFMPERISGVPESVALDPYQAIPAAAKMMARLYRRFGTWELALGAYNWGEGNINSWIKTGTGAKGQPMPAETTDYYNTILARSGYAGEATA